MVQENRTYMYRFAYCYVKNQQDALDIVGEAVYKGLTHLYQLREKEKFLAWMNRIVVHTALDYLRKQKNIQDVPDDQIFLIPIDKKNISLEDKMDLYDAIDMLSPRDRTYIILRFFEDYSFREISEILKEPESTIKSRTYRILEQLREILLLGGEL